MVGGRRHGSLLYIAATLRLEPKGLTMPRKGLVFPLSCGGSCERKNVGWSSSPGVCVQLCSATVPWLWWAMGKFSCSHRFLSHECYPGLVCAARRLEPQGGVTVEWGVLRVGSLLSKQVGCVGGVEVWRAVSDIVFSVPEYHLVL
jgi:hypothetical protein